VDARPRAGPAGSRIHAFRPRRHTRTHRFGLKPSCSISAAYLKAEEAMDVFKTHGAFSWAELMTTDPEAARDFYTKLFGWGSKAMDMPNGTYTTLQVGEMSIAGLMKIPADAPPGMPPNWGCYVTVNDVDATCARVKQLGGKVVMPVFEVPTVGRMAVIQDPQGAVLSIITYNMPTA
jgi:hypothetical protein